ncbi:MAG: hypothetical protein HY313_00245 [Acidobacteria bacterium]|nr:hypothetical protein [Acidobacteriota bacterium]
MARARTAIAAPAARSAANSRLRMLLWGFLGMHYPTMVGTTFRALSRLAHSGMGLLVAITTPLALGGCIAALPLIGAEVAALGFTGFKIVQTTTGGSFEIAVDVSKLSNEQKAHIRAIKSLAVWPERRGGSVSLAEALAEAKKFAVIPPARVAAVLKKLELADDLKAMTATETKDTFAKVCDATGADAVIATKSTAVTRNMSIWSFERANITMEFLTSIYAKNSNAYIAAIPVTIKVLVGEAKQPSNDEILNGANAELAKNILALAR